MEEVGGMNSHHIAKHASVRRVLSAAKNMMANKHLRQGQVDDIIVSRIRNVNGRGGKNGVSKHLNCAGLHNNIASDQHVSR